MSEHSVGKAENFLKDGEMRRLDLNGTAVLLSRVEGQYHAVAGDCAHYGAHLDEGVLKGHTLICPWHHACFDVRSGLRREPPALNDLAHFPVHIHAGEVVVILPQDNDVEPQGKATDLNPQTFVIIGGGAAGNSAAEELRRAGYRGKIVLLSDVANVPIDRPNLSKDYLAGNADPAWMPLRDAAWYADRDIDLQLNTTVTGVDPKAHHVMLENGGTLGYDVLLLATGGVPRQLDVPGKDLANVFLLRKLADADQIIEAGGASKQVVIIGASFIAMEAAASLASGRGLTVTIVGIEAVPFERVLGRDIGLMLQKEHEDNGIQFRLNAGVKQFFGKDGVVNSVELSSGEVLLADFVLVGVGVRPATDFLNGSGLKLNDKDKSVLVDSSLLTSDPAIYAAGDIARYDNAGSSVRIEHWRVAQQQGILAARNMNGGNDRVQYHVPFFWTHQWNIELRYVGHAEQWDEIIYRNGTPEQKKFVAFFVAGGN
ncbi:MAG: FAD-dependent oxidoreductase, partial [Chloroflexota bacterium]